jgi:hypothetical protein
MAQERAIICKVLIINDLYIFLKGKAPKLCRFTPDYQLFDNPTVTR